MTPRSISGDEISRILSKLKTPRDKTLFILAVKTGLRISEILSLKVRDVRQYGRIRDTVTVQRSHMKNKRQSRTIPLHPEAKAALEAYVSGLHDDSRLFALTRCHAWRLIKKAAAQAEITGNISPNSTRKAFAQRMYLALDKDIVALSRALGHSNTSTVDHYIESDQQVIDSAILGAR